MLDDLICRQEAIDAICENCRKYNPNTTACDICDEVEIMKSLPSAQSEIIRCRECREFRRWIGTDTTFCDRTECETKEDDFCSRAERKDE